jgi:hypothetical protein
VVSHADDDVPFRMREVRSLPVASLPANGTRHRSGCLASSGSVSRVLPQVGSSQDWRVVLSRADAPSQ